MMKINDLGEDILTYLFQSLSIVDLLNLRETQLFWNKIVSNQVIKCKVLNTNNEKWYQFKDPILALDFLSWTNCSPTINDLNLTTMDQIAFFGTLYERQDQNNIKNPIATFGPDIIKWDIEVGYDRDDKNLCLKFGNSVVYWSRYFHFNPDYDDINDLNSELNNTFSFKFLRDVENDPDFDEYIFNNYFNLRIFAFIKQNNQEIGVYHITSIKNITFCQELDYDNTQIEDIIFFKLDDIEDDSLSSHFVLFSKAIGFNIWQRFNSLNNILNEYLENYNFNKDSLELRLQITELLTLIQEKELNKNNGWMETSKRIINDFKKHILPLTYQDLYSPLYQDYKQTFPILKYSTIFI